MHQLLATDAGALDVLGTLVDDLAYADLLPHTVEVTLELGLTVRILTLAKLIEIKEKTNRQKDRVTLFTLRETLREKQRQSDADSSGPSA
jgi:hypothetical protein